MDYRSKSFPIRAATVTVRESIGMDAIDKVALYSLLDYDRKSKRMVKRAEYFADAVIRSTVEGDLGFAWASPDDDGAALNVAFAGWQTLNNSDTVGWINELDAINKALIPPKDSATTDAPTS